MASARRIKVGYIQFTGKPPPALYAEAQSMQCDLPEGPASKGIGGN